MTGQGAELDTPAAAICARLEGARRVAPDQLARGGEHELEVAFDERSFIATSRCATAPAVVGSTRRRLRVRAPLPWPGAVSWYAEDAGTAEAHVPGGA